MDKQTPTRDKILLIGTKPSKALRGDIVKVEHGKSKGQLIEVKKIVSAQDRNNPKRTIDLVIGMNGTVVPVDACIFYSLRSEKRPSDFSIKKQRKQAS